MFTRIRPDVCHELHLHGKRRSHQWPHGVQGKDKGRDNAKVAAAASQRPQEIGAYCTYWIFSSCEHV